MKFDYPIFISSLISRGRGSALNRWAKINGVGKFRAVLISIYKAWRHSEESR
jgi:hypothetical protein